MVFGAWDHHSRNPEPYTSFVTRSRAFVLRIRGAKKTMRQLSTKLDVGVSQIDVELGPPGKPSTLNARSTGGLWSPYDGVHRIISRVPQSVKTSPKRYTLNPESAWRGHIQRFRV